MYTMSQKRDYTKIDNNFATYLPFGQISTSFSKFVYWQTNCRILPDFQYVATLPCEMFISKNNNSVKQAGIFIDDKFLTKANKSFYYLRVKMNIQNVLLWTNIDLFFKIRLLTE